MCETIQQRLGKRVRDMRRGAGLSKVDFALRMGISRVSLDLIEDGRANVKLSTLAKLADRLGIEAWELIR